MVIKNLYDKKTPCGRNSAGGFDSLLGVETSPLGTDEQPKGSSTSSAPPPPVAGGGRRATGGVVL